MKDHVFLLGSRNFLRLWSVLGCAGREAAASASADELRRLGAEATAQIILYEENVLAGLTTAEADYFRESRDPYWVPLPIAEGVRRQ